MVYTHPKSQETTYESRMMELGNSLLFGFINNYVKGEEWSTTKV